MIGILGGMGTQAGLDFCNKLAMLNRGKSDQEYPLFMLYNKSNIPGRPESIGVQTKELSLIPKSPKNIIKYNKVLKSLLIGCRSLEKSGCKFIVIPCNTAHYWYDDLQKKINIPIINMPKEVFKLIKPTDVLQKYSVNKTIKYVKMGNVKLAEKSIRKSINYLLKMKCKKIILGCTELPIAIFAFKSFKKVKLSKIFLDPNLILATSSMTKYK